MKTLVCGGRDFNNPAYLTGALDMLNLTHGISVLAHGGARGADTLAGKWAKKRGVPVKVYPADWDKNGKAAGPMRNKYMLEDFVPAQVVGFPGGSGTAHMMRISEEAGVAVLNISKSFGG